MTLAGLEGVRCAHELSPRSVAAIASGVRNGTISPVEVVRELLDARHVVDATICAFVHVDDAHALELAERRVVRACAGAPLGSLHGVPFAVKDMIDVRGWPTRAQSRLAVADGRRGDAAVVAQLRRAGAIPIGKLALEELGIGADEDDGPWPPARNPWALDRTAGGSSSGSGAAVAAGLVPFALGTDTGGSIRLPAAMCGVVGFKPTYGSVSTRGVLPLAPSLDHVGWVTRTVRDCRLVFDALSCEVQPPSRHGPSLQGVRIGVVRHFYERDVLAAAEMRQAIEAALEVLRNVGAEIVDFVIEPAAAYARCGALILGVEAYAVHRHWLDARPDHFGRAARRVLDAGAAIGAASYTAALRQRRMLRRLTDAACRREGVDVIATGIAPGVAWRIGDERARRKFGAWDMRMAFNVLGYPAMALPVGFSGDGLPVSMQLAAPQGEDRLVLDVGDAYEAAGGDSPQRRFACIT